MMRRHKRRALSSSGLPARISTALVWMMFGDDPPSELRIRVAWECHRERNYQRVRLVPTPFAYISHNGQTKIIMRTEYGPVHGNWEDDHRKKVQRVGELLGAGNANVVDGSFTAVRAQTQSL